MTSTAVARGRAPWLRIALHVIRRRRFAPLSWGLSLGLMAALIVGVFPSIARSKELDTLIESYPDAVKSAFGISDASFQTIQGYMHAEIFSLVAPLTVCFFAIRALSDAICGGEHRRALDVLLSAPLTRRELVAGLVAGTTVVLIGILAVLGVVMWAAAVIFGVDLPAADAAAGVLGLLPLALFSGGLAVLLAGVIHRVATVMGLAAGILLVMYLLEVLGTLSDALDPIRPLSAFHYYGAPLEDGINGADFLGLCAAGLVLAAMGAALFERRDIL